MDLHLHAHCLAHLNISSCCGSRVSINQVHVQNSTKPVDDACRSAREMERSRDLMFRLALPHPHISFHLLDRAKGKTVMFLQRVSNCSISSIMHQPVLQSQRFVSEVPRTLPSHDCALHVGLTSSAKGNSGFSKSSGNDWSQVTNREACWHQGFDLVIARLHRAVSKTKDTEWRVCPLLCSMRASHIQADLG